MSEVMRCQALPVRSMEELHKVGQLMAQTEMFGTRNPAEGFVIAAMCHQKGLAFIDYMQTYHFIKGRVSKRADAIQAEFQRSGGRIKIVQRDAEGAVVELEKDGCSYTSRCMWSECLEEPYVYEGREGDVVAALVGDRKHLKMKPKYATPRARMQMMWARAISDGVRAVDPGSVQGTYTPEELEDVDTETPHTEASDRDVRGHDNEKPGAGVVITVEEATARAEAVAGTVQWEEPVAVAAGGARGQGPGTGGTGGEVDRARAGARGSQGEAGTGASARGGAGDGEETPFDLMDSRHTEVRGHDKDVTSGGGAVDTGVCPVPGSLLGRAWAEMETSVLEMALRLTNAEMTPGHRQAVQVVINERRKSEVTR